MLTELTWMSLADSKIILKGLLTTTIPMALRQICFCIFPSDLISMQLDLRCAVSTFGGTLKKQELMPDRPRWQDIELRGDFFKHFLISFANRRDYMKYAIPRLLFRRATHHEQDADR